MWFLCHSPVPAAAFSLALSPPLPRRTSHRRLPQFKVILWVPSLFFSCALSRSLVVSSPQPRPCRRLLTRLVPASLASPLPLAFSLAFSLAAVSPCFLLVASSSSLPPPHHRLPPVVITSHRHCLSSPSASPHLHLSVPSPLLPPPPPPPPVVTTPRLLALPRPRYSHLLAFCTATAAAATPRPLFIAMAPPLLIAATSPVVVVIAASLPLSLPRHVAVACRCRHSVCAQVHVPRALHGPPLVQVL